MPQRSSDNIQGRRINPLRPRPVALNPDLDGDSEKSGTIVISSVSSVLQPTVASISTNAAEALSNLKRLGDSLEDWRYSEVVTYSPPASHQSLSYETDPQSTLGKRSGGYQSHQESSELDDLTGYYPSHTTARKPKRLARGDSNSQSFGHGETNTHPGSMSENLPPVKIEPGAGSPGRYWYSGYEIEPAFPFSYQTRNHIKQEECV